MFLGTVSEFFVHVPGDGQVRTGADRSSCYGVQGARQRLTYNLAFDPGAAWLFETALDIQLQSIQLVNAEQSFDDGIVINQTDDDQLAACILDGQGTRPLSWAAPLVIVNAAGKDQPDCPYPRKKPLPGRRYPAMTGH